MRLQRSRLLLVKGGEFVGDGGTEFMYLIIRCYNGMIAAYTAN